MAARSILSVVPILLIALSAVHTQGVDTSRRLLQDSNPPSPTPTPPSPRSSPSPSSRSSSSPSSSPSPSGSSGSPSPSAPSDTVTGITPAQVPGADYPADVVTCGLIQSATPGANSTSASEGVNRLYQRGGSDNNSKSPVAGTLAATMSCVILTPGPSGQDGAPGLARTVQAAIQRGDSAVRPLATAFAYTFASGSSTLKGYLKQALDAIVGADGCTPIVRLLTSAYSIAASDDTTTNFASGISQNFASDDAISTCFSDYGSLSSGQAVTSAFTAAGASSS